MITTSTSGYRPAPAQPHARSRWRLLLAVAAVVAASLPMWESGASAATATELEVTPAYQVRPTGDSATVSVVARDAAGMPVAGVSVAFSATGYRSEATQAGTDGSG